VDTLYGSGRDIEAVIKPVLSLLKFIKVKLKVLLALEISGFVSPSITKYQNELEVKLLIKADMLEIDKTWPLMEHGRLFVC